MLYFIIIIGILSLLSFSIPDNDGNEEYTDSIIKKMKD